MSLLDTTSTSFEVKTFFFFFWLKYKRESFFLGPHRHSGNDTVEPEARALIVYSSNDVIPVTLYINPRWKVCSSKHFKRYVNSTTREMKEPGRTEGYRSTSAHDGRTDADAEIWASIKIAVRTTADSSVSMMYYVKYLTCGTHNERTDVLIERIGWDIRVRSRDFRFFFFFLPGHMTFLQCIIGKNYIVKDCLDGSNYQYSAANSTRAGATDGR